MIDLVFDSAKVSKVPIDNIKPNSYNPKEKETEKQQNIKRGLEQKGLLMPIFVRESEKGLEIVDGEQRWTSLKQSGNDTALVYNLGKLSDQKAKEMTLWFEEQVPFDKVLQAQLVKDMADMYDDLELPYLQDEIDNMIAILEYDPESLEQEEFGGEDNDGLVRLDIRVTPEEKENITKIVELYENIEDKSSGYILNKICNYYQENA